MTESCQIGGGKRETYHRWGGGSKNAFGEGSCTMFPPTPPPETFQHPFSALWIRVVADVWKKDVWEFQAKSGSSGSCRLFLNFLGKNRSSRKCLGKTPGGPRHPSSRHPRPSDEWALGPGKAVSSKISCFWGFLRRGPLAALASLKSSSS